MSNTLPPDAHLVRALSVLVLGDATSLTSGGRPLQLTGDAGEHRGVLLPAGRGASPFDAVVVLDPAGPDVFASIYEAPGMAVAA
jgi:hypothetical protein